MPDLLDDWLRRLCVALDIDPADVPRELVLDLARDAAHGVARPAAPLTTFAVGYAAGLRGGGPAAVSTHARTATQLAAAFTDTEADAETDSVTAAAADSPVPADSSVAPDSAAHGTATQDVSGD